MRRWRPVLALLVLPVASSQTPELALATPVAGTVARGGPPAAFTVLLKAGEMARVEVRQVGADVVAEAWDGEGVRISVVDDAGDLGSREVVYFASKEGGAKRLVVRHGPGPAGSFEVSMTERRPAQPADFQRVLAQAALSRAFEAYRRGHSGFAEAARELDESLAAAEKSGDTRLRIQALSGLCDVLRVLDRYGEMQQRAIEAVSLARSLQDRGAESSMLFQLGAARTALGDRAGAAEALREAADIARRAELASSEAMATNMLASLFCRMNDYERCEEFAARSLPLFEKLGLARGVASAFMLRATARTELGMTDAAMADFARALDGYRDLKDVRNEGRVLRLTGRALLRSGRAAQALELLEHSVQLTREQKFESALPAALARLGQAYLATRRFEKAREALAEAFEIATRLSDGEGESLARAGLSEVELEAGNLAAARMHSERGLEIVEAIRGTLPDEGVRASDLSAQHGRYDLYLEVLAALHRAAPSAELIETSLRASEMSRARGLIEMLTENRVRLIDGVDPALVRERDDADAQLRSLLARQTRLLADPATASQASGLKPELTLARDRVARAAARLSASYPGYAELLNFEPAGLERIQAALGDDAVLVEYFAGARRTFAWVVTRESAVLRTLAPYGELEPLIHEAYAAISARNDERRESAEQRAARIAQADRRWRDLSAGLSARLIAPLDLPPSKRLLVAADAALHYLPFAALPEGGQPLGASREVVMLPSATAWLGLRDRQDRRAPAPEGLAILADPVFDEKDSRLRRGGDPVRSGLRASFLLTRLPYTRREAAAIAAQDPRARVETGFAASRELVTGGELARYRRLHFATHAVVDNEFPDTSGIVLSLLDARGREVDGVIRLNDVYRLKFNADLVVLSACQTALGPKLNAEGFTGMSRGMLFAGASRVVASLWKVDDAATAEWMRLFYRSLLSGRRRPAEAAREAGVALSRIPRWQSPYYWAAFVMTGDDR